MTFRRTNVDEQPKSEFCRKAEALLAEALAAPTFAERQARTAALAAHLHSRSAWDALRDAEAVEQASNVSRDTSRDRNCHAVAAAEAPVVTDRKLASVGPESE